MRPATELISLHARRSPAELARELLRRPLAVVAGVWLLAVLIATLGAPWLMPHDPIATDPASSFQGPSAAHPFGTDQLGRDLLSRMMMGGLEPLQGVVITLVLALALGVTAGVLAGYFGGAIDWLTTRWADVTMALPAIIILLVVLAIFPNNSAAAMAAYGVLLATPVFRVVRASTLGVRPELHIDAARTAGLTPLRIILRHVLPRITGAVMVQATLVAGATILLNTSLGFLGFGPQPPAATWGSLIAEASSLISIHPWMLVPTGTVIVLTVLALHAIGDTARDLLVERWQGGTRGRSSRRSAAQPDARQPDPLAPGPEDDGLLEVRDLGVTVGEDRVRVLDGASFRVGRGETVGLVGESGCGKSITGRAIMGLLPEGAALEAGSVIRFDGEDIAGAGERRLSRLRGSEIAHVSQDPMLALDPTYTVGAQLAEAVGHHERIGRARARRRAVELLRDVRIPDPEQVARRYPHQISGGMAQRAGIARAICGSPRLLIADEPTTALDVTVQAEILDLLRDLRDRTGMSILLISHDLGVVADLCDRAMVMYAGQLVEAGSVEGLHAEPRHPYTEALQASNPHNAVRGEPIPSLPGQVPSPKDWPDGCRFAERCRYAGPECTEGRIPLIRVEPGRFSRCVHADRVGAAEPFEQDAAVGGARG